MKHLFSIAGTVSLILAGAAYFYSLSGTAFELSLEGEKLLTKKEILLRVAEPEDSILKKFWWRFNLGQIEQSLRQHPLIRSVSIVPCSFFSISCYSVSISERVVRFIALQPSVQGSSKNNQSAWVLSEDGTFVTPITFEQFRSGEVHDLLHPEKPFVIIRGLWDGFPSNEVVMHRTRFVTQLVSEFEAISLWHVKQLVLSQDEVEFLLREGEMRVRIPIATPEKRAVAFSRLVKIQEQLKGAIPREIDLGFEKMAVIR